MCASVSCVGATNGGAAGRQRSIDRRVCLFELGNASRATSPTRPHHPSQDAGHRRQYRDMADRILSSLDFMRVCGLGNESALKTVRRLDWDMRFATW